MSSTCSCVEQCLWRYCRYKRERFTMLQWDSTYLVAHFHMQMICCPVQLLQQCVVYCKIGYIWYILQFSAVITWSNIVLTTAVTGAEYECKFVSIKDTPYLPPKGELWDVFHDNFWEDQYVIMASHCNDVYVLSACTHDHACCGGPAMMTKPGSSIHPNTPD